MAVPCRNAAVAASSAIQCIEESFDLERLSRTPVTQVVSESPDLCYQEARIALVLGSKRAGDVY